jgi:hypothetical protein
LRAVSVNVNVKISRVEIHKAEITKVVKTVVLVKVRDKADKTVVQDKVVKTVVQGKVVKTVVQDKAVQIVVRDKVVLTVVQEALIVVREDREAIAVLEVLTKVLKWNLLKRKFKIKLKQLSLV